jgi:hypothetical protein
MAIVGMKKNTLIEKIEIIIICVENIIDIDEHILLLEFQLVVGPRTIGNKRCISRKSTFFNYHLQLIFNCK